MRKLIAVPLALSAVLLSVAGCRHGSSYTPSPGVVPATSSSTVTTSPTRDTHRGHKAPVTSRTTSKSGSSSTSPSASPSVSPTTPTPHPSRSRIIIVLPTRATIHSPVHPTITVHPTVTIHPTLTRHPTLQP